MKYQNKYRIEPNRWQYWDYSAQGGYFITMCINNREAILGKIIDGKMHLSEKTLTSKQINLLRNTPGRETWQHDYYDHVIRDNQEYDRIQQYIINNPAKWQDDTFNNENGGRCNDDGEGLWY